VVSHISQKTSEMWGTPGFVAEPNLDIQICQSSSESDRWAAPIVFGPRTLWRTWGTRRLPPSVCDGDLIGRKWLSLHLTAPGSAQALLLIVSGIEAVRQQLVANGVDASGVFHCATGTGCRFPGVDVRVWKA
jgi:hypothetical protein